MTRRHVRWFAGGLLLTGIVFAAKVPEWYAVSFIAGCMFSSLMTVAVLVGWPKDGTR